MAVYPLALRLVAFLPLPAMMLPFLKRALKCKNKCQEIRYTTSSSSSSIMQGMSKVWKQFVHFFPTTIGGITNREWQNWIGGVVHFSEKNGAHMCLKWTCLTSLVGHVLCQIGSLTTSSDMLCSGCEFSQILFLVNMCSQGLRRTRVKIFQNPCSSVPDSRVLFNYTCDFAINLILSKYQYC